MTTTNTAPRYYGYIATPIGLLEVEASHQHILAIEFVEQARHPDSNQPLVVNALQQLGEYFAGSREVFDLPLAPKGTDFQGRVWKALTDIGFGETASYRDVALTLDNPKGVRAVGSANGKNPIAIVIPCHRVIGADGTLTGYAGGLDRKAWLLEHESRQGQIRLV